MTDVNISLTYDEYKDLERQLKDFERVETTHQTVVIDNKEDRRYYHKAFRFRVGDIVFEVQGPLVKAPPVPTQTEPVTSREES